MNLPTLIVSALLVLLVYYCIRSVRKNGVCSGDCSECHGACTKMTKDLERAKRDIKKEHSL